MSSVLVDRSDGVAVVTIARPPANALDVATLEEISGTFETIAADNGVTAAVLTGEGGSFSAGLDLKLIQRNDAAEQEALIEALNRAFISVFSCPRYVVAAVNGHAIAGGLILALCCDVRLAADVPLKTGLTEVRVGVPYPVGAIEVVRQELDASVARRLVLGGQLFDASAAVDYGIFDQLVPPAELLEQAVVMARDHPPPVGFSAIKAQLRAPAIARIRDALDGRDPLPRPWLTDETFAAAAAALRGR